MTAEEQAAHVQELCNRYPQFPLPPLTPRTARRPGGGPGAPSLKALTIEDLVKAQGGEYDKDVLY